MDPRPKQIPEDEPETEEQREKEKRRREQEKKFGYLQQNIDGITAVFPQMSSGTIPSDVLGSYTGTPEDNHQPTQDADDL